MAWRTSIIALLPSAPDSAQERLLLEKLGVAPDMGSEPIDFEEATSSGFTGIAVGSVAGWTIVCDRAFFSSVPRRSLVEFDTGAWSEGADAALREWSADKRTAYWFILQADGAVYGLALYEQGVRRRLWLCERGHILADQGAPLECERPITPRTNLETYMLGLFEGLCVSFDECGGTTFARCVEKQCAAGGESESRLADGAGPAIPAMIEALASDDPDMRMHVASDLASFAPLPREALEALVGLLADGGKYRFLDRKNAYPIRFRVALMLLRIAPDRPEIVPVLGDALRYRGLDYAQAEAVEAVIALGPAAQPWLPILRDEMLDENPRRRFRIQRALELLDPQFTITDEELLRIKAQVAAGLKAIATTSSSGPTGPCSSA